MKELSNGSGRTCQDEPRCIMWPRHLYPRNCFVVTLDNGTRWTQGSIIGPSQFTAYTEDIQEVIMLNYHFYADDTQVIAKSTIRSTDVACRQLENCVASVLQWCASLNADKTELIWFGSAAHLEHLQAESVGLTIAVVNVEAVDLSLIHI